MGMVQYDDADYFEKMKMYMKIGMNVLLEFSSDKLDPEKIPNKCLEFNNTNSGFQTL